MGDGGDGLGRAWVLEVILQVVGRVPVGSRGGDHYLPKMSPSGVDCMASERDNIWAMSILEEIVKFPHYY